MKSIVFSGRFYLAVTEKVVRVNKNIDGANEETLLKNYLKMYCYPFHPI